MDESKNLLDNEVEFEVNTKTKKKKKLFSDAFPTVEKKNKIAFSSGIHKVIQSHNFQIKIEDIYFRVLTNDDIPELVLLHKEWLPIDYDDKFFKRNISEKQGKEIYNIAACTRLRGIEYIVGSIFCEMKKENENNYGYVPFELCNKTCWENCFCRSMELCYIMTIGVIDECRRIGLGSRLIVEFSKFLWGIKPNCKGIFLHVIDYNQVAIKFYSKIGFQEINIIKNYYHIMDEVYDGRVLFRPYELNDLEKENKRSFVGKLFQKLIINPILWIFCCSKKKKKTN